MAASPVFLRLMSNSIAVANHAGKIKFSQLLMTTILFFSLVTGNMIREIMRKGELGIVDKVN